MCFTSNNIITVLIISLWTIVQTSFHIIWCLYGYYSYVCKIQPNNYWLVIVYLTYFYNNECGDITVEGDLFSVKKQKKSEVSLDMENVEDEDNVYSIVHTIVKNATLPLESSEAYRTALYLIIYIFLDGFWIITSLLLLAGACFQIKKCLSVFFYGPWILVTGASIILDTVSSVHFGLDLLQINSYTSWIKFIGVSNYEDFRKFDGYNSSSYVSRGSAILMCSLFSRLSFFWVLNIISLFRITNIAILAFRADAPDPTSNYQRGNKTNRRSSRIHPGENLDSSDARIRNWQLFYGAVGTMTTSSSSSSQSSDDVFYNSRGIPAKTPSITPVAQSSQNQEDHLGTGHISPIQEFSEIVNNVSSHYMKFSDVAEDINLRKASIESLQSQLPWTYIKSAEIQGHLGGNGEGSSSASSVQRMKNRKGRYTGIDSSDKTVSSTAL